jgi:GT2 family glycosyltransferase/glycosyltransferase involved in cell wall biosynthesis
VPTTNEAESTTAYPTTIVVPIYDHWASLERCLASIVEHVDLTFHKVILINDCGPNADSIESKVLRAVQGVAGIEYFRNETNLGFVGTCNRAALELDTSGNDVLLLNSDAELTSGSVDEMSEVLHLVDHHGIVCARSDNATIATLPFFKRNGSDRGLTSAEQDLQLFDAISPLLPRYYVSPVAVGFCYLVKRSLIDNHGLFDTAYGVGYNEENDFCMRVNALGYSSLIANRTWVRHLGSASFGETKNDLDARNHAILMSRYPSYIDAVETFINYGYAGADVFAEAIAPGDAVERSILVDIHHLSLVHNGSTRYALSFLRTLATMDLPAGLRVIVACQPGAIDFFSLRDYGLDVVPYSEVTGIFDVGIALAPVNNLDQLIQMNRHCARWLVSHFDMIASRSWALMLSDPLRPVVVEHALHFADGVIALSEFSYRDASAFYPHLSDALSIKTTPVALGSTRQGDVDVEGDAITDADLGEATHAVLETGGYVVIMGNFYPHKQVGKALAALAESDIPVVAFGPLAGFETSPTTAVLTGGTLSEAQLNAIFENASLLVFPSAYEGYGLPIADSLDFGVPVVAFDTSVAREVVADLGGERAVRFFKRFADLAQIVADSIDDAGFHTAAMQLKDNVRGLTPYHEKMWSMAVELLDKPIDVDTLSRRFETVRNLERVQNLHRAQSDALHQALAVANQLAAAAAANALVAHETTREILGSRTYRAGSRIAQMASPLMRVVRASRRR